MKKLLILLLAVCLLCGCAAPAPQLEQLTYLDVFDTVTTIRGYETDPQVFRQNVQTAHEALLRCHQLFDIYNDYEGINNLKTVNDQAGIAPVAVAPEIIALLRDCRSYYDLTGGKMNPAMGSVLRLWHEKREAAAVDPASASLPDPEALTDAAKHCSFDDVLIDEAAGTVFIADPALSLDVGAVAKGWSAQYISCLLPKGYLIDLGCNICATGAKPDGKDWVIGVQSPDGSDDYLCALGMHEGSAVTSGDYHRWYEVNGQRYHHIIDPDTLQPAAYWRSVTVLCPDSGLADALSTALFTMDYGTGLAVLEKVGSEAMWAAADGTILYSPGFETSIKK